MACPLASAVTRNGFEKSGRARIGSDVRASFKRMNANSVAWLHKNILVFLRVEVIGEAMRAYAGMKIRYQPVRPRNPHTYRMFFGDGQFFTASILTGSVGTPSFDMIKPTYSTLFEQKVHLLFLAKSLC